MKMAPPHRSVSALLLYVFGLCLERGTTTGAAAAAFAPSLLFEELRPPPRRRGGACLVTTGTAARRRPSWSTSMSRWRRVEGWGHQPSTAGRPRHLLRAVSKKDDGSSSTATVASKSPLSSSSSSPTNATTTNVPVAKELTLQFELVSSILDVSPNDWDACAAGRCFGVDGEESAPSSTPSASSPFVEHAWIRCLEETGCASPSTGWIPQHIRLRLMDPDAHASNQSTLAGYVPLYIKGHSLGEFVFDQPWADAAYQNGIDYYPKLLVGVPFTPATGPRVLWHPTVMSKCTATERKQLLRSVGSFLRTLAVSNQLSSVHVNFLTDQEATDWAGPIRQLTYDADDDDGDGNRTALAKLLRRLSPPKSLNRDVYLRRTSLQYHWVNINPQTQQKYDSFQEYLSCFKSKRRITIKRERAKVRDDSGIRVDAVRGRDILRYDGLVDRMFDIYKSTIDKMVWGRQYLTLDFFQAIVESDFVDNLCFLCARRQFSNETLDEFRAEDVFAGTFNVIKDGVFYGRYWGCLPDHDVKNLHFEVCYWSAIEYCIEHGLDRMEPGAGGGDYKWARGFDPALTHSVHYICNPGLRRGVAQFLDYETENNVEVQDYLRQRSSVAIKT